MSPFAFPVDAENDLAARDKIIECHARLLPLIAGGNAQRFAKLAHIKPPRTRRAAARDHPIAQDVRQAGLWDFISWIPVLFVVWTILKSCRASVEPRILAALAAFFAVMWERAERSSLLRLGKAGLWNIFIPRRPPQRAPGIIRFGLPYRSHRLIINF